MNKKLFFTTLIAIPQFGSAQLAPHTSAPLHEHLLEVNAQWTHMDEALAQRTEAVHFANEAERIATHLHLVREILADRTPEGLSAESMEARTVLLEDLQVYASNKTFPQNYVLDHRNPIFIDPHNTACAVGHLMRTSGNEALAANIQAGMNQGYVHELLADERFEEPIAHWATEHGFTADELAWIQPGYPPPTFWYPPGGGTDGHVTAMYADGNGNLLIAGKFNNAGSTSATRIAKWDGTGYSTFGSGLDGDVHDLIEYNGALYAGGSFQNELYDLASWDGNTWTYENMHLGMAPRIYDLHVKDGILFAAGQSSGFAGVTHAVMMRNLGPSGQSMLGSAFNGTVRTLATFNGDLVAGGDFNQILGSTDPLAAHVARFDDIAADWEQLGNGLNAPVHSVLMHNGALYAGGQLVNTAPVVPFGLAKLDVGSSTWAMALPGHENYIFPFPPATGMFAHIEDMTVVQGKLFVAGSFVITSLIGSYGESIAEFDAQNNSLLPIATMDSIAYAVAGVGNTLYVGGAFNNVNFASNPHISSTGITVGIEERPEDVALTVINEGDRLIITSAELNGGALRVMDAQGKIVRQLRTSADRTVVDIASLSAGHYNVSLLDEDGRLGRSAFVKE